MPAAVLEVAQNGVAVVRKLHANLVLAARLRPDLQQPPLPDRPQQPVTQDGLLSALGGLVCGEHLVAPIVPHQPIDQASFSGPDALGHQRPVTFLDRASAELLGKPPCRLGSASEQHQARDRRVQPADGSQVYVPRLAILLGHVLLRLSQQARQARLDAHRGEPRWLQYGQQMIVLVDHVQGQRRAPWTRLPQFPRLADPAPHGGRSPAARWQCATV